MSELFFFLKPFKKQLILGPLAKLAEAIIELTLPFLMAWLIDYGIKQQDRALIIKLSVIMVFVSCLGLLCAVFCQYSASITSQGFGTKLRNALVRKISTFSHKEIDQFGTETLLNRTTNDVNQLQLAVAMLIRLVIRAPFLCIGGIIMAINVNFRLALILIVFIPIFVIVLYVITKKTVPIYKLAQKKLDDISLILKQNLFGVRVIRAFAHSRQEEIQFDASNSEFAKASIKAGKISALLSPLTLLIMNVATLFIIYFGGVEVNKGLLSQGELIALLSYVTQIMLALIVVANLAVLYNKSFASMHRVLEILNVEVDVKNDENISNIITDYKTAIEFKNVFFNYNSDTDEYVLSDICFKIESGQTVGIIGGTGSGKTSLVNLIARFYNPTSGDILIKGAEIKYLDIDDIRNIIGFVPQFPQLFKGTIKENICMGNKNATEEEIIIAAKISQSYKFISEIKDKFDTTISQDTLSGGQKQRLTIARALLRQPKILILDDSASALDYLTDLNLRREIKKLECTTIIVSQRINAIKDSDFILVMDDGKIVGNGTHDELLKTNHLYQEIYKSQTNQAM